MFDSYEVCSRLADCEYATIQKFNTLKNYFDLVQLNGLEKMFDWLSVKSYKRWRKLNRDYIQNNNRILYRIDYYDDCNGYVKADYFNSLDKIAVETVQTNVIGYLEYILEWLKSNISRYGEWFQEANNSGDIIASEIIRNVLLSNQKDYTEIYKVYTSYQNLGNKLSHIAMNQDELFKRYDRKVDV